MSSIAQNFPDAYQKQWKGKNQLCHREISLLSMGNAVIHVWLKQLESLTMPRLHNDLRHETLGMLQAGVGQREVARGLNIHPCVI